MRANAERWLSRVTTSNPILCPPERISSVKNPEHFICFAFKASTIFLIKLVFPTPVKKNHYLTDVILI